MFVTGYCCPLQMTRTPSYEIPSKYLQSFLDDRSQAKRIIKSNKTRFCTGRIQVLVYRKGLLLLYLLYVFMKTDQTDLCWHSRLFMYQRLGPDSPSVLEITAVGGLFWWLRMENWMARCESGTIYTPTPWWWRTNTARESQGVLRGGKFAITLIIAS